MTDYSKLPRSNIELQDHRVVFSYFGTDGDPHHVYVEYAESSHKLSELELRSDRRGIIYTLNDAIQTVADDLAAYIEGNGRVAIEMPQVSIRIEMHVPTLPAIPGVTVPDDDTDSCPCVPPRVLATYPQVGHSESDHANDCAGQTSDPPCDGCIACIVMQACHGDAAG